jgi:hypothetical protein
MAKSRSARWQEAAEAARAAMENVKEAAGELDLAAIEKAVSEFDVAAATIIDIHEEVQEKYENMSDNAREGERGEMLGAITEIDTQSLGIFVDDIRDAILAAVEEALADCEAVLDEIDGVEFP